MSKNLPANAPDRSALILKRNQNSGNWVEIISSKHLKVKVFNLGLSFLFNFYIRERKMLLNALLYCLAMNKGLIPTSKPPEPSQ